ncbi:TIGR04076 family protein [Cellulomonas shaoxiangyii]|uniref:TIGR04076 family protein n=1 Tax=Cellulomonas shaoxiangyii TaxID=2566013 RepID=A0A4P7SGQ5_9CELL|nr:TIGR04076 family protein [Cellulomonas shaoxiangyii]QCB92687.1 TIGR04076 family protein [Cellulomonas shaoxiangyii]TGY83416.1 TIGR04076 family protein [Cellulomonas shaoxiangyii]
MTAGGSPPATTDLYDLRVVVERIEGRSVCGMQVGDCLELSQSRVTIPDGRHFCLYALSAVLPLLPAKQRDLAPGDWLAADAHVACPDPEERLVMRIERTGRSSVPTEELT